MEHDYYVTDEEMISQLRTREDENLGQLLSARSWTKVE